MRATRGTSRDRAPLLAAFGIAAAMLLLGAQSRGDDEAGWIELGEDLGPAAWKQPTGAWFVAGDAAIAPDNDRRLVGQPGSGVIINGPTGKTVNLVTKEQFGDVEVRFDFLVPKGSNSGVKFAGLYEIQILDSYGIDPPRAQDCGGIYPRAELLPKYHYLDEGTPPLVNAARPAGEWQTLHALFIAPRFDDDGKKVANARLAKVELNGQLIHEDLELKTPTGHAWTRPEKARGPLLFQADHGPVAFRSIRVRPRDAK